MDLSNLLSIVIWLVVVGVIFYVVWWFVGWVGLPQPFDKIVRVLIGLVALVVLINFLLPLAGQPPIFRIR